MLCKNSTSWGVLGGQEKSSVASCLNLTLARDSVDLAKYAIDVFAT